MWKEGNPCALLVGMQTGQPLSKAVGSYFKKLKVELLYDPETSFWEYIQRNWEQ